MKGCGEDVATSLSFCDCLIITGKGETGVADFLVKLFKRGPFLDTCGFAPLLGCNLKVLLLYCDSFL